MSIPESIKYLSTNLRVYMRLSEYEKNYQKFSFNGLWIDQFKGDWIKPYEMKAYYERKSIFALFPLNCIKETRKNYGRSSK